MLIVAAVGVLCVPACAEEEEFPREKYAEAVLSATSKAELYSDRGVNYLIAAEELFRQLSAKADSEDIWNALFKIREWFDGSAHEEYAYLASDVFVKNPEIFYERFLAGDSRAVILLQDAFVPGTWVLQGSAEDDERETKEILTGLQSAVADLKSRRPKVYSYDVCALHDTFVGRAVHLLEEWPKKRQKLLEMRQ